MLTREILFIRYFEYFKKNILKKTSQLLQCHPFLSSSCIFYFYRPKHLYLISPFILISPELRFVTKEVFYSKTNFSLLLNINNTKCYYIVLILFVWLNYIKLICIVAKIFIRFTFTRWNYNEYFSYFHLFHRAYAYTYNYCTIFFHSYL